MTSFIERETLSDVDLLLEARTGDESAVEELYRRHRESALRFARSLTDPVTAEDVVAEAFVKVLETIRSGGGPEVSFRPYLLTAVRNTYVSHVRRDARHVWVDDQRGLDRPTDADVTEQRHESTLLASAFAALPERWQTVLWHSTVEGEDHDTIGRRLGLKPNAVAALGFRARDGLRKAYLDAHLGAADERCRPYREQLAPYVRGHLRSRQREEVQRHLDDCPACTAGFLELSAINTNLGAVLAPALLGSTAAGYAALTAGGSGGLVGGGGALRHWIRANRTLTATGAAVAATVVVTAASFALVSALDTSEPGTGSGSTTAGASTSPDSPAGTSGPARDQESTGPATSDVRPRVPALPVVTPLPTPTSAVPSPTTAPPTPSPEDRSDVLVGPGGGKPVGSPSYAPTPPVGQPSPSETTPPTEVPEPTTHDLALTGKSWFWNGPHHHLQMTVTGAAETTALTIRVRNLESYSVHAEAQYVPGTCTTAGTDGDLTTLTCALGAVSGTFAIDVVVTGGQGALDATVRISATENLDPDPANDELHYTG
ncbi:MAG TPA: sigma-70 family RNA polymerase sigma factor [Nocardioides sp.]|uniref:sigma-70 family RNA polymerase sigma factor n=1 Tax=Nocardioides sp. TaxID=35761 RepID=UPI002C279CE2|nr:sigma-70 family RNA polymerase sigma factor [Nocardioides sp.]HTW16707.1 sigma-70 family RNA polymerase sigma factor [Nocardioides sp.]